ncbi:MAG: hypothetical protein HKN71_00290, partial [Gemmatimonadetes bacterium]|nr:hypothetical protein [Gemmatimonadota bacterium]
MDRRESLKVLLLGALGARSLSPDELAAAESGSPAHGTAGLASFRSRWAAWPNMSWAGPEYWGNRLQDWRVRTGRLVSRTRGPNRTLHCLTHRAEGANFTTRVHFELDAAAMKGDPAARVGLRFGLQGRFPGVRSAAVHGTGIDAAIDAAGYLWLGENRSATAIDVSGPVELRLRSRAEPGGARVELTGGTLGPTGESLGIDPPAASHIETLFDATAVLGNLALLSHHPSASGASGPGSVPASTPAPAATFLDWTIDGPDVQATPAAAFGPIWFAQYTLHRGILKLTAQLAPIDGIEGLRVGLELRRGGGGWTQVATAPVDGLARTAEFRIEGWDAARPADYRVVANVPLTTGPETFEYRG